MHAVSTCPLPVASLVWQSHPSVWMLTVVCKATFVLLPSESVLAPDQEDPLELDDHWNDDPGRSLRTATDLVPMKPRAEVTLVGHAFAPGDRGVRSLVARILVGEVDKAIEVHGDRSIDQEGAIHEGPLFSRMPLLYERAAGGPGTANPVGVSGAPNLYGRIALPNLQPPGLLISSADDYIPPIGFGPIPPGWPSRLDKLGASAAAGAPVDGQYAPLPADLDPSYFNHAPRDQQVQLLRDNERIVLENLHPEHPRLATSLPGVRPRATVERNGTRRAVPLRCDTLWIDTDRALCTLTWRAQVPLEDPEEEGRVVFSLDKRGTKGLTRATSTLGNIQLRSSGVASDETEDTLPPGVRAPMPSESNVLPFAPAPPPPRPSEPGGPGRGLPFIGHDTMTGAQTPSPVAVPVWIPPPQPPPPPPSAPDPIRPPMQSSSWAVSEGPLPGAAVPMTVGQLAAQLASEMPARESAPELTLDEEPEEARSPAQIEAGMALQLVWFDPECLPRVRRKAVFQPLLAALEERPLDSDLDDPAIARDPMAVEDRRDVFEVLARGEAAGEAKLDEAVEKALREDGKFVPPFLLLAGELRFAFDELAALRATLSIASPFAPGDDSLKVAVAEGRELLKTPDLMCSPGVIEGFTLRIQEAFRKLRRTATTAAATTAGYLEEQTERVLLEKRCYQRREVFGATHLRAMMYVGMGARPWPVYLPEAVAKKLPMFARFQARVLAEACLQEDQYEQHPGALKVSALARVAPMPTMGERGGKG